MQDAPQLPPEDVARVVRVQQLVRGRQARRRAAALAGGVYRKCVDAASGWAYYCNLRTGGASWRKPALLGERDAEWLVSEPLELAEAGGSAEDPTPDAADAADAADAEADALDRLNSSEWAARFAESVAFQRQCHADKLALARQHRRRAARARRDWDRAALADKQRARAERLARLAADTEQQQQSLRAGESRQNTESIREAALRGHADRVQELLALGFSPDAESAMGLTPLLAACQSGHVRVAVLLLASGADVNHAHVATGRTALMEACSRASAPLVTQLLRYGARIHARDVHGETALDGAKDAGVRAVLAQACAAWSAESAALFPAEFRAAARALALVGRRQRGAWAVARAGTRRELAQTKQRLQRALADARVRYDADRRACALAPTALRRLAALEAADERLDAERAALVRQLRAAVDARRAAEAPRFLADPVVRAVLSFCGRHWFQRAAATRARPPKSRRAAAAAAAAASEAAVAPTRLCAPPDELPRALEAECAAVQRALQETREALAAALETERFDAASGVARTAAGESLAQLDVHVVQAERLPFRDPRTLEPMDPLVRVLLRERAEAGLGPLLGAPAASEPRLAARDPVWDFCCRLPAVPSARCELVVQVLDHARDELAGEASVPLRALLDQREHDEWLVLPPTLRQQVRERTPRRESARVRVRVTFSHTKSLVLTRELQAALKTREAFVNKRREHVQQAIDALLRQLP